MASQQNGGQQPARNETQLGTLVKVPGFQIGVSVIAVGLAALMSVAFLFGEPSTRETLHFIVVAGALSGGVITAHHVWLGLKTSIEQRTQALEEQKIGLSLAFLSRWNDPNMSRLRTKWRKILPNLEQAAKDGKNVAELIKGDLPTRTVVADVLNFFEEMGYAAKSGAADLQTLEKFFKGVCARYFRATRTWIELRRSESKEASTAWIEFEWLCDQWKN